MTNGDAIDEIRTIASSKNRVDILGLLRERDEIEKRELRERFDVSRPTLQRNLDTLEEAGWIRSTLDGYAITVAGEMVVNPFADLMGSVETAAKLQPLLRWTSAADLDLDPHLLADAEVTVPEPNNPYAPVNRFVKRLRATEEFRAVMAVVARDAAELVWRRVTDGDMTVELVLTRDAAETVRTDPSFSEMTDELLDADRFDLLALDGDVPFFLGLLDEEVHIGVENDDGVPQALAISTDESVREWARDTYEDYRRQSRTVS